MIDILTKRSLRAWIALGMACAVLPLGVSAVGGYVLLKHGVVGAFDDVAARRRDQIEPTQRLRLLMWEALGPIDEYVDEGDPGQPAQYRLLREQIEAEFAEVHQNLTADPEPRVLVERARDEWTAADAVATELISVRRSAGDPAAAELMDRVHGQIAAAVDRLGAVHDALIVDLDNDHDAAELARERAEWLAGVAAAASLLMIIGGVLLIGRTMTVSVDRLVDGAARFAAGDRDHRIEVRVPPELVRVAREFNRMATRIREAEERLAELVHTDSLTRLLNRRAFDDALAEAFSRARRFDDSVTLLMIDIDHFKQINDRYGHATGDEVLRAVAGTIGADARGYDRAFRIGGEEFAVLLQGSDLTAGETVAERLRSAIEAGRISVLGEELSATVSVGVATAPGASDSGALVRAADSALYRAKEGGRNRVVVGADVEVAGHAAAPV